MYVIAIAVAGTLSIIEFMTAEQQLSSTSEHLDLMVTQWLHCAW
jgi:hypothetical protein